MTSVYVSLKDLIKMYLALLLEGDEGKEIYAHLIADIEKLSCKEASIEKYINCLIWDLEIGEYGPTIICNIILDGISTHAYATFLYYQMNRKDFAEAMSQAEEARAEDERKFAEYKQNRSDDDEDVPF